MELAVFVHVPLEAGSTCLNLHKNRCERFSSIPSNLQQLWLHCQILELESIYLTISLQRARFPKPSSHKKGKTSSTPAISSSSPRPSLQLCQQQPRAAEHTQAFGPPRVYSTELKHQPLNKGLDFSSHSHSKSFPWPEENSELETWCSARVSYLLHPHLHSHRAKHSRELIQLNTNPPPHLCPPISSTPMSHITI